MKLSEHPTVKHIRQQETSIVEKDIPALDADWLRQFVLDVGADLHVIADTKSWLGFLAKEKSIIWALLWRKIRLKGSPKLLLSFGKCFPS